MDLAPMLSDLFPRGHPYVTCLFALLDIVDKLLQAFEAAWSADDAAMKTDGHHLGRSTLAFFDQDVERITEVGGEVRRRGEARCDAELHVVVVQRVGYHEQRRRRLVRRRGGRLNVVRQIFVV